MRILTAVCYSPCVEKLPNNYAFIDGQNLNLGIKTLGWNLDYKKFRLYLQEKYNTQKAYIFMGFVSTNQSMYSFLEAVGFTLIFRPITYRGDGKIKGNIDTDLVLQVLIDWHHFHQAVIVSGDGDFCSLVDHLYSQCKLEIVLSPCMENCSALLQRSAKEKIFHMNGLGEELQFEKRKAP